MYPQDAITGTIVAPRRRPPHVIYSATGGRTEGILKRRDLCVPNASPTGCRGPTRSVTRHEWGSACGQAPAQDEGDWSAQMGEAHTA